MSSIHFSTLSTVSVQATSTEHISSSIKHTATAVVTTRSATPTIDSLLPTTFATLTKSSTPSSTAWSYPLPSSPASTKNSTSTSSSAKLESELKTYKLHYRNMIIALTIFALIFVAFFAFKIWRFVKARKARSTTTSAEGGRKWYGVLASKMLERKGRKYEEIEISRPQRPAATYFGGSGPGGAQMI